jgi:hypothetical protein
VRPFRRKSLDVSAARAVKAEFSVVLSPEDMLSGLPVEFRDTVSAAHSTATAALVRAEQVDSRLKLVEQQRRDPDALEARVAALEAELERASYEVSRRIGGGRL